MLFREPLKHHVQTYIFNVFKIVMFDFLAQIITYLRLRDCLMPAGSALQWQKTDQPDRVRVVIDSLEFVPRTVCHKGPNKLDAVLT